MRIHRRYLFCFFFLALCGAYPVFAQYEHSTFTRYAVKDGLTDNGIYAIQQDDQGYLWLGTDAGLNRFDGKTFKKFYQETAPLQLPSGSIWRLKRFGPDQLGVITRGGFQLLNTKNYSSKNYIIPDSSAFSPTLNTSWDAVELTGKSYAVTTASGFYVFNQAGKVVFRHDAFNIKDIGKKRILYGRDIYSLPGNKHLVFINDDRVAIYNENGHEYKEHEMSRSPYSNFIAGRTPDSVHWIVKYQLDKNRFLFIPFLQNKVVYYEHNTGKKVISELPPAIYDDFNWESRIEKVNDSLFLVNSRRDGFYALQLDQATGAVRCNGIKHLKGYKVYALFVDKDKRLWAGTTDGLLKQELNPPVISAFHFGTMAGTNYTGGFSSLYQHNHLLYAGRFSLNRGLSIIDQRTMKLIKELDFFGGNNSWNEVRSIEMYYPDTLWIGANAGIIWLDTKSGRFGKLSDDPRYSWTKNFSAVFAPARDDGYAWMCSMLDGKVARYHIASRTVTVFTAETKPALPFDKVKHVVYDSYGDVWIGGHSLTRWNNKLQVFDTVIGVYGGRNKFRDDIIMMRADNNGALWIHNAHNGLLEYRINEKKFVPYSMKDGLSSDILISMGPVVNNKLWLAGNNHLNLFDTRSRQFTIYDGDDGLPEQKPSSRRIFYDEGSGLMYLCTPEYLVRFPNVPERKKDLSSELVIEEIRVGEKSYYQPGNSNLSFRHRENNITIDYSIIDFEHTNYQFAWRLDDEDPWNAVGQQRSINLNNLTPGRYTIQLKASGKPGIEKIRTISFRVQPPVWKKTWFIALAVLLLAGCGWLLYRNRVRQIRQKANIDKMLSQTEMKALQAQMNPHFIFNSLNSIREMILSNENKEASRFLSKFAHLIRITLDQSTQSLVSLRNTIDYLQRYMEMESIRNSLLSYTFTIDPALDIDEIEVPPMLIQPFIENALWHGVSATDKRIHIQIGFKKEKETLVCTIDDNGIGIDQSHAKNKEIGQRHRSMGIANIRNRVALLNEKYGLQSRFTIIDKKETIGENGTLVSLHLPIEIKES